MPLNLCYNRSMKSAPKRKPMRKRPAQASGEKVNEPVSAPLAAEDERDLHDALRARDEAKQKGVYPWEWLKQEIEA